jgi:hypothetical protein
MKLQPGQLDRVEVDSLQSRARFRTIDLQRDLHGCLRRPDLLPPAALLSPEALDIIREY